jgi:hypothetical protein
MKGPDGQRAVTWDAGGCYVDEGRFYCEACDGVEEGGTITWDQLRSQLAEYNLICAGDTLHFGYTLTGVV